MKRSTGFTLIEMVVTLIILGVITAGVMNFGIISSTLYVESKHRLDALEEARFVLTRFKREVTNSVPLSPRLLSGNQCIEYIPLVSAVEFDPDLIELDTNAATTTIPLTHPISDELLQGCATETCRAVIYPRASSALYLAADASNQTYTIVSPVVGADSLTVNSPVVTRPMSLSNRMYIYQQQASQFCAFDDSIFFYRDYELNNAGSGVANSATAHLFAQGLENTNNIFSIGSDVTYSNIVNIHFSLSVNGSSETVEFMQYAQILNSQ